MQGRKQGLEEGPGQTDLLGTTSARLGPFLRERERVHS